MKRSQRWNNLQIYPRRDSNMGGSDLWSNTLPLDNGGAIEKQWLEAYTRTSDYCSDDWWWWWCFTVVIAHNVLHRIWHYSTYITEYFVITNFVLELVDDGLQIGCLHSVLKADIDPDGDAVFVQTLKRKHHADFINWRLSRLFIHIKKMEFFRVT